MQRSLSLLLSSLAVAAGLALWWGIAASGLVSATLLASPPEVWAAFLDICAHGYRGTSLGQDVGATLGRLLAGFVLAVLAGVPLGLWMGLSARVAAAVDWAVQFLRPLPPLSYMILLILWFGVGDGSKVALLFLTAFPIVASAAMAGVRGVRVQRVQAARTLGASPAQVTLFVVLPAALPTILTGTRIALAAAFSTVVSAELLAATDGLGWMVLSASRFLRSDVVMLCILILGGLGMALSGALVALDGWLVHWRGRE